MEHTRRFWVISLFLAASCGGRTLLPGDEESPGGSGDGGVTSDGPILRGDGPISVPDGRVPIDDSPITIFEGGEEGIVVEDAISVPPFEGGFDGPIIIEDGGPPEDGGFPDVISFPPDSGFGDEGGEPVFCGGSFCETGEDCCVTFSGGGTSASCVPPGTCDMGLSLACTGSDNCPTGDVCCGTLGFGGGNASCEPGACAPGTIQLCTVDGDCPMGEHCDPSPIGLSICRHHH
jgi:hypothetical protein